jgi:hypothetical protein
MVVHDLNVKGIRFNPAEADPPLIVHPNAVLPRPVTRQCFQAISWYCSEIGNHRGRMDLVQLSFCDVSNTLQPPAELTLEDLLGILVPERPDHISRLVPFGV